MGGEVGVRRGGGGAQEREQSRLVEKEFPSKLANSSFSVRDFPLSRNTPYSLGASQTLWTHHEKGVFVFVFKPPMDVGTCFIGALRYTLQNCDHSIHSSGCVFICLAEMRAHCAERRRDRALHQIRLQK